MAIAASDVLTLLAAIPLAAIGGASFLNGMLGIAAKLRLPNVLVATTLAAFATSSPELAVSSLAALAGQPGIGLGDALGSNVVNFGLILGAGLLWGPLAANLADCRRDFLLALAVPVLTWLLMLDGTLVRAEGLLLLALFALWMVLVTRQAIACQREAPDSAGGTGGAGRALLQLGGGLAALVLAGQLFIAGASAIALAMGLHPYIVGATVVAAGTSLPELVTVVFSRLRGHDDVGLGTLLGSNLFNGLAIVGVAAAIHPITVPRAAVGVALAFGMLTVLLVMPRGGAIGLALLAAYGAFVYLTTAGALPGN